MRTEATNMGGFIAGDTATPVVPYSVSDCYAAGEVGSGSTDMENPLVIGGFQSVLGLDVVSTNCYYDKQTTAMREWAAGDTGSLAGISGVFTTGTQDAGGAPIAGLTAQPGTQGFTGFTDNTQWAYVPDHYPQLAVFANADAADWGSAERADLVRAYSAASTATVMLDTWDAGYDWDDDGVRTADKVSYDRTLASTNKTSHKGNALTYDTVREITSGFRVTGDASYSHMVGTGAPSEQTDAQGNVTSTTDTVVIDDVSKQGRTQSPGMDWYRISSTAGTQTGSRPVRLIGYMGMDVGGHKTVPTGEAYDHRADVELIMMDTLTDNLVVGMDDTKVWSTSRKGGYPPTDRFWAAPTTNMETSFSASKDAWIYTEVWRAAQNADGSYVQDTEGIYGYIEGTKSLVPDMSVKVTGKGTGAGATLTEQKWNGDLPLYPDISTERKYIVSYYWMLSDGRYATDYKVVTTVPTTYDMSVSVKEFQTGQKTDPADAASLHVGAAADDAAGDPDYTLGAGPAASAVAPAVPYTQNSSLAYKKADRDVVVEKTQIDLYANGTDKPLMGTASVEGGMAPGDTITVPTTYYYLTHEYDPAQGKEREVTNSEVLDISYTLAQDAQGAYFLRFNKLANVPAGEAASALAGTNDSTGIPEGARAYINDTSFNTELTVWTGRGRDLSFVKTDEAGAVLPGVEFMLYGCTHAHGTGCGGEPDEALCTHYYGEGGGGLAGGDGHSELADAATPAGCWDAAAPLQLDPAFVGSFLLILL